ncbi:MAG: PIG-L family deacetylase [Chloroflexi bacterium]|nr:PIG-L family deacetylase [Chloroflexota bacterium]
MTDEVQIKRILVVAAHPDDAEFGAAGSIFLWTSQGKEVFYLICTNGDKGTADRTITPQRLAIIREEEQHAAAKTLGVKEVVFLRHPDGYLEYTNEFRGQVVRYIRKFKPELVLTSDPLRKYFWHHDHRIAGTVVLDAVYPYARDHLYYPEHIAEGLSTHAVRELYLWGSEEPDTFIDITGVFDKKIEALRCHVSQVGDITADGMRERVSWRASDAGKKIGVPLAESFKKVIMPF